MAKMYESMIFTYIYIYIQLQDAKTIDFIMWINVII